MRDAAAGMWGGALQAPPSITATEFECMRAFLYEAAGISLSPGKPAFVCARLAKRLRHHGLVSFGEYHQLLVSGRDRREVQIAIDLLTTNETCFFREPKHFDFLRDWAGARMRAEGPLRVWSAASSSGEEAYSIAMVLADVLGARPWEVIGTDISSRMIARARSGHYSMARAQHIPRPFLLQYCLKGTAQQAGSFLMARALRQRVRFAEANLAFPVDGLPAFDCVFLRNVMIYFDAQIRRKVLRHVLARIKPGGHLLIGHSETLNGMNAALRPIRPAIYQVLQAQDNER